MKGTHCGTRALALAALLISLAAVAPAVAGATVIPSTPAAPPVPASVPAVPAAPSVPAVPAAPSVPAPTASKAAAPATPSAPVSNTPVSVSNGPDGTSITINVPIATAHVGPSSGSVSGGASLPLKPVETAVAKAAKTVSPAYAKATKAAKATVGTARKHKGARALAWANDDDGFNGSNDGDDDDNPMSGCVNGTWTTCTTVPLTSATPLMMNNRCVNAMGGTIPSSSGTFTAPPPSGTQPPVGSENVQFNQGTMTTWTRAQPGTFHGLPAMFIDVKTFNVGLHGVGTPSNADYRMGHDFVDDFTIVILIGGSSENKRTQDVLIVNQGAAPNMWYSEHDIFSVSMTGFQLQESWRIVCQQNQKADDDPDQGDDHDRSGDMEKYRHAHRDYNGYQDDQPSSYDQND